MIKQHPLTQLNLPPGRFDIRRASDGAATIYDRWRRRWVALTPEEWVRQHFCLMLVDHKGYMSGRIANEVSIELNSTKRRCDTVVYNDQMTPLMIVEYKAPEIKISQAVFDQIARYASVLRTPYIAVSNGLEHYCCHIDYRSQQLRFLQDIPDYRSLDQTV